MTEQRRETGIRHTVVGALRSPGKILGARKHAQPREQAFHDQAYKRVAATTGSITPDASHSVAPAVKPAARRRTSQEAAVVVATPAKRDRVVTETVYTAPADSRSVDKTPRQQRREAAAAAYVANKGIAAEEDRVVVAEVDRDNHGNGHHVNWTAVSGLVIAGAILYTGLRGNGGTPIASATSSPDNGNGHPTDSLKPSASPSAAASASETVLNVNNLNVQTLISLFKLNPSLFQAFQADGYALDPNNLSITYDKDSNVPGVVISDDKKTGLSHLIATLNSKDLSTVAQGYWDAKLPLTKDPNLNHQAISFALAPGNLLPAKKVTEWAVDTNLITLKDATGQATKGQAKLEAGTQPNVCTLEITKTIQAVDGNEQTVKPDNWEAEKLTPDQAASLYGRDAYSEKAINWKATPDGFGMILQKPEDGTNTIIDTVNAVAQVYWDVKMPNSVSEGHQVVAGTLAPNVTAPVREATVYKIPDAVVENVKDDAALNTWAKHVNLEINGLADPNSGQIPDLNKIQKGVYVALVTDSVCPLPSNSTTTAEPTQAEIKARATAAATEVANAHWYDGYVKLYGTAVKPLTDGTNGIVITEKTPVTVTLSDGQVMDYYDGATTHKGVTGPLIVPGVLIGTIYPHK